MIFELFLNCNLEHFLDFCGGLLRAECRSDVG